MAKKTEPKNQPENNHFDQQLKEQQIKELTELLQRTQANFENYRKQTEKRSEENQQLAAKEIILSLLPILDNFELALKNLEKSSPTDFRQGIKLIYSQLFSLLEEKGVKPIITEGLFDPYFHEALLKVHSDLPENVIIEEFQKGFILNGKVIRHAKVKVSAGQTPADNSGGN